MPPAAELDPPYTDVEARVLIHLATGRQAEAERLLAEQLRSHPGLPELVQGIAAHGVQPATVTDLQAGEHRGRQRLLFLCGACIRSRFSIDEARAFLSAAAAAGPKTAIGECAGLVVTLDTAHQNGVPIAAAHERFMALGRLADGPRSEPVIQWMAAVQCRTWNRNVEGVAHYKKLLTVWKPGPVLVHQTYANQLGALGRHEEALAERRLAVEMEPAGWSYDGLASSLYHLKRYAEADAAHAEAVRRDPRGALYWRNWAITLKDAGRFGEAIEKATRSVQCDSADGSNWWVWATCLLADGQSEEALVKFQRALALQPDNAQLRAETLALEKELRGR
ncbi:MAG TPA: tetratricopeptide repeat protein [Urbifossiella sp.]|nr:tetratricopeptide repeat protein [Urbifossiella sp.]